MSIKLPQEKGDPFFINYTKEYETLMNKFLNMLDDKTKYDRSQQYSILTEVISKYPQNYTAWSVRNELLKEYDYNFQEELKLLNQLSRDKPKSYQIWHSRMVLLLTEKGKNKDFDIDELNFFRETFEIDSKNFHAWSYLLWYAKEFNRVNELYNLCLEEINKDMRNNSCWNARKSLGDMLNKSNEKEFDDACESLKIISRNEAPFNFAIGCIKSETDSETKERLIAKFEQLGNLLYEKNKDNMFAIQIKLYVAQYKNDIELIKKLCAELIEIDPIRTNYYTLVSSGLLKFE